MELGAEDQISRLLQRMREERSQAKPPTVGARPHTAGRPPVPESLDEEDDEDVMPSRYVKPAEDSDDLGSVSEESDSSLPRAPRQARAESLHAFERAESSDEEVEDPRTKLSKRMDELRARRQMLGPPSRVQPEAVVPERKAATPPPAEDSEKESPPESPAESPAESPVKATRPRTAHIARTSRPTAPSFIRTPVKKAKRTDPVSLYQQRQKEWQTNKFLKANKENAKEGRKLKLAEYSSRPSFHVVHEKPPVPKPNYVAPHEKRRDDVRFQTRVTLTQVKMAAPVELRRPQTAKS